MNLIDYVIVFAYLLAMLGIGFYYRKQTDQSDYFLGGRTLPWQALSLSVMATQLSAVSFISAPAFVGLREGGGLFWLSYELAIPLAMLFLLWFILPSLHASGVVSVYDFLEKRFNRFTRVLISFVFQISRSFATAIMIYAITLVLQSTMGLPFWLSIVCIGLITLIYSAFGGMKAVVIGDAVQMLLIIFGAVACLWVALSHLGGFQVMLDNTDSARLETLNYTGYGLSGNDFGLLPMLFGGLVLYASYYGCDQSEAQRSLSSRSIGDLRKILVTVGLARFPITLLYCFSGLAIGALVATTPEFAAQIPSDRTDWMVPIFILNYMPIGLTGLLVVAMMAAAMSSLSSAINSLAAVSLEDYIRISKKTLSPTQYVSNARWVGVFWGVVTLGLSTIAGDIAPTIIEAINKIGSLFYGPILAIFLLGIYSKKVGALAASGGLLFGVGVNIYLWLSGSLLFWFWWNVIGFVIALCVAYTITFTLTNQRNKALAEKINGLTLSAIVILVAWFLFIFMAIALLPLIF
ncbi:sodium:solute symporter family transporter [Glaciecola petra]|uniref:Sodium/solute symporter n=1 Tax=Glaciecola petra TaxID=3075602 RepID=A0ABU2ZUT9_9ALTE|nr:sodium/solute symporter [Aestuariibacter sp. P117]MDT0595354.1 sodium/solute symporter [Aestuariibacter sp. P117]